MSQDDRHLACWADVSCLDSCGRYCMQTHKHVSQHSVTGSTWSSCRRLVSAASSSLLAVSGAFDRRSCDLQDSRADNACNCQPSSAHQHYYLHQPKCRQVRPLTSSIVQVFHAGSSSVLLSIDINLQIWRAQLAEASSCRPFAQGLRILRIVQIVECNCQGLFHTRY